jgi:hypothetical protein
MHFSSVQKQNTVSTVTGEGVEKKITDPIHMMLLYIYDQGYINILACHS